MNKIAKFIVFTLIAVDVILLGWLLLRGSNIALLNPKGLIALKERNVIITALLLMLLVVIPVVIFAFYIAWRYRDSNTKVKYSPDWDHNRLLEITRVAIPGAVVLILAVITWKTSHALDPYKPIEAGGKPPLTIQVIALDWKWLFIYPEQHIATVNFIQFPVNTPINFELTADAPINSFWIPQLGGQMYAMAGMVTRHHLMADVPGEFTGSAAEINGQGFSGMRFVAKSTSQTDFDAWVTSIKHSPSTLTLDTYNKLAKPSENNPRAFYSSVEKDLYNTIIKKFMAPAKTSTHPSQGYGAMPGMQM